MIWNINNFSLKNFIFKENVVDVVLSHSKGKITTASSLYQGTYFTKFLTTLNIFKIETFFSESNPSV